MDKTNSAVSQLKGAHILLVEDDVLNQELILELLQMEGMTCESAFDGQQALELLEAHHYDGVLMDCQMPVMGGYETTLAIRQNDKFRDLPIIALTANVTVEDVTKALGAGMNDHVTKPLDPDVLFATMARWIAGNPDKS